MFEPEELYLQKLKQAGYSNTLPRAALFNVLRKSEHQPLNISETIELMQPYANRSSVYRSVKLLEKIGIIQRLNTGWKYKLELSDEFHGHHHHLTCTVCGTTNATVENKIFENMVEQVAKDYGYLIKDHQLEIRGICSACQGSSKSL